MSDIRDGAALFTESLAYGLRCMLRFSVRHPTMTLHFLRTLLAQKRAARTRKAHAAEGLQVPPFMIVSVTKRCNLSCRGCYSRLLHRSTESEMDTKELRGLLAEAAELGISLVLLGGGEPLSRPDILDITKSFPQIVFALFTNGLLIDEQTVERLRSQRHLIPIISMEGLEPDTDNRRGKGVHERVIRAMGNLSRGKVFFGTALTVTRNNFSVATDERFIKGLISIGCRFIFHIGYVPVVEGTEELVLTDEQISAQARLLASFRKRLPALFIAFPGDEYAMGGCLAAGRGFVHVSPEGHLEPCPFSPFSDVSLRETSLRDALKSKLLRTIRENRGLLDESNGVCALWNKREWVASLVASSAVVSDRD